jgi:hypothetical protein
MFTLKPGAQLFVFPVLVLALAMGTLRVSRFSGFFTRSWKNEVAISTWPQGWAVKSGDREFEFPLVTVNCRLSAVECS